MRRSIQSVIHRGILLWAAASFFLVSCGGQGMQEFLPGMSASGESETDEEMTLSADQTEASKQTGQERLPECKERELDVLYVGMEETVEETVKDTARQYWFLFEQNGEIVRFFADNGEKDTDGNFSYPIQNLLKEGYRYRLKLMDERIVWAEEVLGEEQENGSAERYVPPVSGTPGERTVKNLLATALMPVGTTLYIYGGGWNWQDNGSSVQARSLGLAESWIRFFDEHDETFTYKAPLNDEAGEKKSDSYYPYGGYNRYYYAGLDCSGYLGWVIYNTFENENGKEGYVGKAFGFAKRLEAYGWGDKSDGTIPQGEDDDIEAMITVKPGDIVSIGGHVWLSLGTCADGSIVILHSTPSKSRVGQPGGGVQISALGESKDCEAYRLADQYMSVFYPEWYRRYPTSLMDPKQYLDFAGKDTGIFSWETSEDGNGLADPEGIRGMTPGMVLELLFQ